MSDVSETKGRGFLIEFDLEMKTHLPIHTDRYYGTCRLFQNSSNFNAPDDTHRGYLDCYNFSDICEGLCALFSEIAVAR